VELPGKGCRITHPSAADELIDEAEFDRDERLPYWAELWPSAIALARYLSGRDLSGRRAIELGCGVGLPSVAALSRGARVLATDYYAEALDFTLYNARANTQHEPELQTSLLDWRSPRTGEFGTFDLVLAADVLYERRNVELLSWLVGDLLAPGGELAVADPGRKEAAMFLETLGEQGFEASAETMTVNHKDSYVWVWVHRLRRAGGQAPRDGAPLLYSSS
jgi:predicted nicotinamide N-methyase